MQNLGKNTALTVFRIMCIMFGEKDVNMIVFWKKSLTFYSKFSSDMGVQA